MSKRTLAALLAVMACVLAGSAVVAADNGTEAPITNDTEMADAAYVADNGSVVLVSEGDTVDGVGSFGMNVADGVVFGDYAQSIETNVTGAFSMGANQSRLNTSGSLAMPRPDALENLDVTIDSETSAETATSDLDAAATIALPENARQSVAAMFGEFTTNGSMTMTGSALSTQGSAEWSASAGFTSQEQVFDLRATEDGHVLDARQSYTLNAEAAETWNTREKAARALEGQFTMVTRMLNGSSDVTVDAYNFTEGDDGGHLEIEYTAELRGIDEFLRQGLASSLSQSAAMDGTSFDSGAIDTTLENVSIERVSVALDVNQGTMVEQGSGSVSWNVSIAGYDELMLAYMQALEATDETGMMENQTDRFKAQFEAMQASSYAQTATWDVAVSTTDDGTVEADLSMHQAADNWGAYVEARDARDLPAVGTQQFSFDAATEGEQVIMNGSFRQEREDMFGQALSSLEDGFEQSSSVTTTPIEMNPFARLNAAEFAGSQFDLAANETTMTADGYAEFGNLSSLTSMVDEEFGVGSISGMYVDASSETPTTYLWLDDVAEADSIEESALREHQMIGENTTIYMPEEWSGETMAVTVPGTSATTTMEWPMENHPDDVTTEVAGGTTTSSGPGFGVVIALVAVALVGFRRR